MRVDNKTAHFSVDDAIWLFLGLRDWNYGSVFEQPVLSFFRDLHEKYGITVSFYCFMTQDGFDLKSVPDRYREELESNRAWCRFGFHAIDENTRYENVEPGQAAADYAAVMAELRRIAGEALDAYPRIHCYSASQAALLAMREQGLRGVLCPEMGGEDRYGLTARQRRTVDSRGVYVDAATGLSYLSTDIRVEETSCVMERITQRQNKGHLEIFTHEWALEQDHVQEKIVICCDLLKEFRYDGAFWGEE